MCRYPGSHNNYNANKAKDHIEMTLIVGSKDDVVHISRKASQCHERDMNNDERQITRHKEKVNGSGCLPASKHSGEPHKTIDKRRVHPEPGQDGQRPEHKDHTEVDKLLKRIVSIESVGFWGKVEIRIIDECAPRLGQHHRRSGNKPSPLFGCKKQTDKNDAGDDKSVDVDE